MKTLITFVVILFSISIFPVSSSAQAVSCNALWTEHAKNFTKNNVKKENLRGGTIESHVKWWSNTEDGKKSRKSYNFVSRGCDG